MQSWAIFNLCKWTATQCGDCQKNKKQKKTNNGAHIIQQADTETSSDLIDAMCI